MRMESGQAPVGKKPVPLSKSGMIASRSFGPPIEVPRPARRALVIAQNRRHAQRVMLRVRASVHVALKGQESTFDVTTLSVNSGGALVVMERSLPPDTHLVLENAQTRERVACHVTRTAREMAGGYQVPIEFDSPAPDFWRITFPPSDWRPTD